MLSSAFQAAEKANLDVNFFQLFIAKESKMLVNSALLLSQKAGNQHPINLGFRNISANSPPHCIQLTPTLCLYETPRPRNGYIIQDSPLPCTYYDERFSFRFKASQRRYSKETI